MTINKVRVIEGRYNGSLLKAAMDFDIPNSNQNNWLEFKPTDAEADDDTDAYTLSIIGDVLVIVCPGTVTFPGEQKK